MRKRYLYATAACLTLAALGGAWITLRPRHSTPLAPPKPGDVITQSTHTPSETKPAATYTWKGAPTDPKKIAIPAIGVDAFVQKVGIDQHKEIAVPSNIHMAGWFTESVLPGQKGLSIIDGHVDGVSAAGVFEKLSSLVPGTALTITFGDGSTKHFTVTQVVSVNTDEAANVLFSQDPAIPSQINLITCTGTFDAKAHQYTKRSIVSAKLD